MIGAGRAELGAQDALGHALLRESASSIGIAGVSHVGTLVKTRAKRLVVHIRWTRSLNRDSL